MFQLCQVQGLATFGGIYWMGIDPTQIRAALQLLCIPRKRWTDIALDVDHMGDTVADHRNRQTKAPARR